MAKQETPRVPISPEEKKNQAQTPGLEEEDGGNPYVIDPSEEPLNTVDRDDQPVADRARGVKGMWDREDANPDETLESGDGVEVKHIPAEKKHIPAEKKNG
jgi:hypothetical protein